MIQVFFLHEKQQMDKLVQTILALFFNHRDETTFVTFANSAAGLPRIATIFVPVLITLSKHEI